MVKLSNKKLQREYATHTLVDMNKHIYSLFSVELLNLAAKPGICFFS